MSNDLVGKVCDVGFHMLKTDFPKGHEFVESFRPNQVKCKSWLVDQIANYNTVWENVLVLGSWNSCLMYELMSQECLVKWWDFVDVDLHCHNHRDLYFDINNMRKNYNSICMDATQFSAFGDYDLIINTSCEHMPDIPPVPGPLYALQSNNYSSVEEHINVSKSLKEFVGKTQLTWQVHADKKDMGHYERYMVLGYFD